MSEILFHYRKVDPTTWVYLSSLLTISLFFKFNRFWSVRNLDLALLILLAPGLLMVNQARQEPLAIPAVAASDVAIRSDSPPSNDVNVQPTALAAPKTDEPGGKATAAQTDAEGRRRLAYFGYLWLFGVSALWVVRLLIDPTMVRRPLLEPNLSNGGLLFMGCALFIFLMANVITSDPTPADLQGAKGAQAYLDWRDNTGAQDKPEEYWRCGPGLYFLHLLPSIPTHPFIRAESGRPERAFALVAKSMAISCHLAVVIALIIIGYWHFENIKMGIGAATLYLMVPYTAQMTGHVDHVLPAALLLWAIVLYRRPMLAGVLIGLALSVFYYPLFLLPLWISFYWQRGFARFIVGVLSSVAVMVLSLVFVSKDLASFWLKFQPMFALWIPFTDNLKGIWDIKHLGGLGLDPWYRLPVIVSCAALAGGLAIWPSHKNLGTLLSCSAAMMVAVQFWHGFGDGGGMYMAWYLPLLLMTVFRPNLEDRVALTVLGEGWFNHRRARISQLGRAA
jgi:hypothetical protein